MYDPSWPHGHTFCGNPCRVLATDIIDPDGRTIAIAWKQGDIEYVGVTAERHLMPIPVPKKRIHGWISINRVMVFGTKEYAKGQADNETCAIVYIDVEEGEGMGASQ